MIHDEHLESEDTKERFSRAILRAKKSNSNMSGHQTLLAAHRLSGVTEPEGASENLIRLAYQGAVTGDQDSQLVLCSAQMRGLMGAKPDLERAYYWCNRAASAGAPDAYAMLAIFYMDGLFVQPDYKVAYSLISEAAVAGSELASKANERLKSKMSPEEYSKFESNL